MRASQAVAAAMMHPIHVGPRRWPDVGIHFVGVVESQGAAVGRRGKLGQSPAAAAAAAAAYRIGLRPQRQ